MSEQQVAAAKRLNLCVPSVRKWRTHCDCMSTDNPPKRPDPALYSQVQRLSQGMTASWNNPDISYWRSHSALGIVSLLTEVDSIAVSVHNESNESSAVSVLVEVKWAPFGIGTTFSPLGAQVISLGIAPDQKRMLFPISDGIRALGNDVSLEVNISHPHDKNAGNNTGFDAVHSVSTLNAGSSPSLAFPLVNTSAVSETITLVVLANDIGATVTPAVRVYAPNEQITATLSTVTPASVTPSPANSNVREATVVAYNSHGRMLGGVTFLVWVNT